MSKDNQAIAVRWLEGFWGKSWTPRVVDDLAAPEIIQQFSLQMPRRGRKEVKTFLVGFHETFRDLEFHNAADLVAEGDYVVGRLEGGGIHTGPTFTDAFVGFFPTNSGQEVHLSGTVVLRIENGKIAEDMTRLTWAAERPRSRTAAV
jgi:predicted ester cyclase